MDAAEEKSLDHILRLPLTAIRVTLAGHFLEGKFDEDDFDLIVKRISKKNQSSDSRELAFEIQMMRQALAAGELKARPNLDTPETQLLWGAALTYLACHPEVVNAWPPANRTDKLDQTKIWDQLVNAPASRLELCEFAYHINESIRNPSATLHWSTPGSWYFFNPENNDITLDFLFSLISGFEHSRAVMMHEVGHSQLTTAFPPAIVEGVAKIKAKQEAIEKKVEAGTAATREEYTELLMLEAKHNLLMEFFNPCEDNCVNRYTANVGKRLPQDYSVSANHTYVTTSGFGLGLRQDNKNQEKPSEARKKFDHLKHVCSLSFFSNNDLFKKDAAGWKKMLVHPDWIQSNALNDQGKPLTWQESFARLCAYTERLETTQPKLTDRIFGKTAFMQKVDDCAKLRGEIMTKIWNEYAEGMAQELLKEQKQSIDKALDAMMQGKPMPGNSPLPATGQGPAIPVEGIGEMPGVPTPSDTPQPGKDHEKKGKSELASKPWSEETNKEAGKDPAKGKSKEGEGEDANKGKKTLEDLLRERSERRYLRDVENQARPKDNEARADAEKAQNAGSVARATKDGGKKVTSTPRDKIDDLTQRYNFPGYMNATTPARYAMLASTMVPEINALSRIDARIREKYCHTTFAEGKTLNLLPEDGDLGRFDSDAHRDLLIKRYSGRAVDQDDLRRFKEDDFKKTTPKPKLIILVDHSASTFHKVNGSDALRLETAMKATILAREAAIKDGWDTSVYAFGGPTPYTLATPAHKEADSRGLIIGTLEDLAIGVRDGRKIGCGNEGCAQCHLPQEYLAPAVVQFVADLAQERKDPDKPADPVFVLIISDGQIHDMRSATIGLQNLVRGVKNISVDALAINDRTTALQNGLRTIPNTGFDMIRDMPQVPDALNRLATARLRKTREATEPAIPNSEFRNRVQKSLGNINRASL